MKLGTSRWRTSFILTVVLLLAGLVAPAALAVPPSANASITPSPSPAKAGATQDFTFSLSPTSGQISSFNLTAPSGWSIEPLAAAPAGVTRPSATQIQGRSLSISASSPFSLNFTAQAPCTPASATWSVAAKTGANFNGSSFSVTQPTTTLDGSCSAAFVTGRTPSDAAFNANTNGPSENITSVPYTPGGTPIQAVVLDANGDERPGTSVTLHLTTNPHGATLAGSRTAVTDASGVATFPGSPSPITLDVIGQGYKLTPRITGTSVGPEQGTAFGIYQEGEACSPGPCEVHGHSGNNRLTTIVTAPSNGNLGVLVTSDPNVLDEVFCEGFISPFTTEAVVVWKYTGDGSQTIVLDISKAMMREVVDRGSDHIEFCFDSEGKPFTDKFGVDHWGTSGNNTDGLLSDCNTGIDPGNCVVSQTGLPGGGRRITVTVVDGKGRP